MSRSIESLCSIIPELPDEDQFQIYCLCLNQLERHGLKEEDMVCQTTAQVQVRVNPEWHRLWDEISQIVELSEQSGFEHDLHNRMKEDHTERMHRLDRDLAQGKVGRFRKTPDYRRVGAGASEAERLRVMRGMDGVKEMPDLRVIQRKIHSTQRRVIKRRMGRGLSEIKEGESGRSKLSLGILDDLEEQMGPEFREMMEGKK